MTGFLWVILSTAQATDPVVHEVRWESLRAEEGDEVLFLGDAPYRVIAATSPVRLRCPNDLEPERLAITFVADGQPAALRGPFSVGHGDGPYRTFEHAPGLRRWLVPADCTAQRISDDVDSDGLARLEQRTEQGVAFDRSEIDPLASVWIATGGDSLDRWLAARPFGPWYAHLGYRATGGETVHWAPFSGDPARQKHLLAGDAWSHHGPLRLDLSIRALGTDDVACVTLDGTPHCAAAVPEEDIRVSAGALVREAATFEGAPVSQRIDFRWLLDSGEHTIVLGVDALVELTAGLPVDFRDGTQHAPVATETLDPPSPWTLEQTQPTTPIDPVGTTDRTLLSIPSDRTAFGVNEARWLPLSGVRDSAGAWVDRTGTMQLWLEPEGDAPCTVAWGQSHWTAFPTSTVHRFRWTGPNFADTALPEVWGCTARVRVVGALHGDSAASAARYERLAPGLSATWVPPTDDQTYLWLATPEGHHGSLTFDVDMVGRGRDRYEVLPLSANVPRPVTDSSGRKWSVPVRIPLPVVTGPITVTSTSLIAVRMTGTAPADATEVLATRAPPSMERISALSRRVADATTTASRASALRVRADALHAAGHPALALEDLARAVELTGEEEDVQYARIALWQDGARALGGRDAWAPVEEIWVPGSGPDAEPPARAAAAGDNLAVARLFAASARPESARPWWRRAILGGQTPTFADRQRMYLDVARVADEVDSTWTWPLRSLSSWESVHLARGPKVRATREVWPDPADPDDALRRELFPDVWPLEAVVQLKEGWDLALPPSTMPRSWEARCRVRRALEGVDACQFELTDESGKRRAQFSADPWGVPTRIDAPASSERLYLHVAPAWAVEAEIRATDLVGKADLARRAWTVPAGTDLTFEVLAPTVVRLDSWDAKSGGNVLTLTVNGGPALTSPPQPTRGRWILPIDAVGPISVTVRPQADTRIDLAFRMPAARSVEPASDRKLLAHHDDIVILPFGDLDAEPPGPPPLPLARPTARTPLTVTAGATAGTPDGDVGAADGNALRSVLLHQDVGITTHPGDAPVWAALAGWHETSPPGSVFGADGGFDWRIHRYSTRWWLRGDVGFARGQLHDGIALSVADARLGTTVEKFVSPRIAWVARLDGFARGVVNQVPATGVDLSGGYALWNTYLNDHPAGLLIVAEGRYQPGPWTRATARVSATSNAPGDQLLERWTAGGSAAFGIPAVVGEAGFHLVRWVSDNDRLDGRWDPLLSASIAGTPWFHGALGSQLYGDVTVGLLDGDLTALTGLRFFASGDRALDDVRPSDLSYKYIHAWGQDGAAERSWRKESQ